MARTYKLTWQSGTSSRAGRWRKKYRGKVYYFDGGRGKTDRDAYQAALSAWERMKLEIDGAAPKPHQADYERAIARWEQALAWCRKHGESEMADLATQKLELLRRDLSSPKPRPVNGSDTFEGQFDLNVRFPGWQDASSEIVRAVEGRSDNVVEEPADQVFVIPPKDLFRDDNEDKLRVWSDRLEVESRSGVPDDQTVQAQIRAYVSEKQASAAAEELSKGRPYTIQLHLSHFADWIGRNNAVNEISGKTLTEYRTELLRRVKSGDWSSTTAKDRLGTVRSFVRWLWHTEAIPALPRNLDSRVGLKINKATTSVVTFTKDEIATLLASASDRTKLYVLLSLNCGMTQKDIADLDILEVNWEEGRITRKRSKTSKHGSVPVVSYVLWRETYRLLQQERSGARKGPALLNAKGARLWFVETSPGGKLTKNDNVRNAFARLTKKTKIDKPLKSLKKTSASLIRNNSKYASLESLFLGHAPQSMADKHYAATPQELLDEAIGWLAGEYGLKDQDVEET